jgi:hypothetical protein
LPARILAALDEQTVIVPATEQYGRVISGVAAQLLAVLDQRVTVAGELDALLAEHPLAEVLTSMPGRTICGESQPRRGNRALKSALYLSAFARLKDPTSRAYYDRKRAEGKNHPAALALPRPPPHRRPLCHGPRPAPPPAPGSPGPGLWI